MSANTLARWNAIPLDRSNEEAAAAPISLKRGRPDEDDDDEDDDDVSLVSRSPSPLSQNDAMDVDETHLHKYDEYIRRPAREVITVDTKIKPSNKGFALLAKLGWVEGQPVGLSGDGRVDPIPFHIKSDSTGLGKASQDVRMIEETVSQRRGLDSERQQRESEEQRRLRQDTVARKTALESEISSTLRAFYCTLCDKQFKNVAQYDEHTNSYAHHHKARFKDMQANVRLKPQDEVEKRKEKERKREEKELRKIAAASGIKIPKPAAAIPNPSFALAPPPTSSSDSGNASSMEVEPKPAEPKRSNWASVHGSNSPAPSHGGSGFSKSGWATVGGPSSNSNPASSSRFGPPPSSRSPSTLEPAANPNSNHIPTFRNAGWTSLDTGSSLPLPAAATATTPNHHGYEPGPPDGSARGGWSRGISSGGAAPASPHHGYDPAPPPPSDASASVPARGGWSRGLSSTGASSAGLGSSSSMQWQSSFAPPAPAPAPPSSEPAPSPPALPPPSHPPPAPENKPARSNWQQFQKGVGRRK